VHWDIDTGSHSEMKTSSQVVCGPWIVPGPRCGQIANTFTGSDLEGCSGKKKMPWQLLGKLEVDVLAQKDGRIGWLLLICIDALWRDKLLRAVNN
jgi:hypothetical protein